MVPTLQQMGTQVWREVVCQTHRPGHQFSPGDPKFLNMRPVPEVLDSNAHFSPDSYSPQAPFSRERLHDTAHGEKAHRKVSKANASGI